MRSAPYHHYHHQNHQNHQNQNHSENFKFEAFSNPQDKFAKTFRVQSNVDPASSVLGSGVKSEKREANGISMTATSRHQAAKSFDFAEISAQLPPNTGPPGTVPVTNGSSSTNNKNLSHVPCKFFKQGMCQAGDSCPFSHNIEGALSADKLPCKYFLKGNCKFGLKCALAHYLPDGTRVNPKNFLPNTTANGNGQGLQVPQAPQAPQRPQAHAHAHAHGGNGYQRNRHYSSRSSPNNYQSQLQYDPTGTSPDYDLRLSLNNNDNGGAGGVNGGLYPRIASVGAATILQSVNQNHNHNHNHNHNLNHTLDHNFSKFNFNSSEQQQQQQHFGQRSSSFSQPQGQGQTPISLNAVQRESLARSGSFNQHNYHLPNAVAGQFFDPQGTSPNGPQSRQGINQIQNQIQHKRSNSNYFHQNGGVSGGGGGSYSYGVNNYGNAFAPIPADSQPINLSQPRLSRSLSTGFYSPMVTNSSSPPQVFSSSSQYQPGTTPTSVTPTSRFSFGSRYSTSQSQMDPNFLQEYHLQDGVGSAVILDDDEEEEEQRQGQGQVQGHQHQNGREMQVADKFVATMVGASVFEEDFLPSSLADVILTPQELQRRDSRSQSGTLNIRPNMKDIWDNSRYPTNDFATRGDDKLTQHDDLFLME
ncbi:uncharacterized protein LODBEIA_P33630 [Lodderomyces beijingensis]|uniref:C3H1-type domain-containing protein n=1 Tax=Lodderomyces beijingensis TaxID=1775926 RepID=A0ABP0ZMK9_9ASCO